MLYGIWYLACLLPFRILSRKPTIGHVKCTVYSVHTTPKKKKIDLKIQIEFWFLKWIPSLTVSTQYLVFYIVYDKPKYVNDYAVTSL